MVLDALRPVGCETRSSSVSTAGCSVDLGDAGAQVEQDALDHAARADGRPDEVVGEDDALFGRESPEGEADARFAAGARHAQRQVELDRELEVDVEEVGPQLHRAHVAVEVARRRSPR